jgi:predicted ATPase
LKSRRSRPTRPKGSTRYRLLETVRDYAAERLARRPGSELEETRAAHRDYYLAVVETAGPYLRGPDEAVWLDRLEVPAGSRLDAPAGPSLRLAFRLALT